MFRRTWIAGAVLVACAAGRATAGDAKPNEVYSFGSLKAATANEVRAQAQEWLKAAGKTDAPTQQRFDAIWSQADRPVLDKVADTLALDAAAAQVLKDAGDIARSVPKDVPAVIKDKKQPEFFRANLALLFAKSISSRRVFEEALDALKSVKAESVADPSSYFFHRAVAEHALMKKEDASQSILRLLDDVSDAPDRYKMVATLMFLDMQSWKKDDKDLSNIAKLMDNSGRRLDLARAGKHTQEIQKKIVFRLDEVIKELENQAKSGGT